MAGDRLFQAVEAGGLGFDAGGELRHLGIAGGSALALLDGALQACHCRLDFLGARHMGSQTLRYLFQLIAADSIAIELFQSAMGGGERRLDLLHAARVSFQVDPIFSRC